MKITQKLLHIVLKEAKKQNITLKELAGKSDCTIRAIMYWQSGDRNISLEMADKLLKAVGLSVIIGKGEDYEI